jgi:gliding motility-associated-like protein
LFHTQTVAYTINVAYPPAVEAEQTSITNCIHPAGMKYTIHYGFAPRNIIVYESGTIVKTIVDNSQGDSVVVNDSLPAGNYTVIVRSDMLCIDSVSFTITDTGSLPVAPVTQSYCRGDGALPIVISPIAPGATIAWFNTDSTPLPGAPVVSTASENVFSWYFIEDYSVCSSGPVPVTATVHQLPHGQIVNIPQTICYGDAVYLKATGGTDYAWQPAGDIQRDTGGYYIEVLLPVTVVVHITDEFGCKDTTSVTFADIQDCCRFSYPNAFTPNNDGNNDGFRIVTWGNMRKYALTIFNRWGQPVFFTADPKHAWDGTFHGEPCDIGTYYYYLDAECLTGPKEWHKGDVVLIR